MDLQDPSQTRLIKDSPVARLPEDADDSASSEPKQHHLDTPAARDLHSRVISWYRQELNRQSENRYQMAVDEDYFDNIQWTEEDAQVLRERGQAPLVYNVIATSIRWITGTEKRARIDFKVLPRRKTEAKAAEKKTSLLKYLSDVNRTPFARSRAFKDAVVAGVGWLECGLQDEDDGEPLYDRYESWRNILWDSASTENDLSDCRFIFRTKWLDVDVAKALLPADRHEAIEAAAIEGDQFGGFDMVDGDEAMDYAEFSRNDYSIERNLFSFKRRRVRVIEAWFKQPERAKRIMAGPWKGQTFDQNEPRHQEYIESLAERLTFTMHYALMTTKDMLVLAKSPYRHNRFPFVPVWGYKRSKDGMPYGAVRGMRDIQDDINKRAAKAQYLMSVAKVEIKKNEVDDIEEFREEWSRPDAVVETKSGTGIKDHSQENRRDAQLQLEMFSRGITMIQQVGGITDEMLARTTNATSGVAIKARQEQGGMVTMDLFDNLRFADQLFGEIRLSLIEQFMTEEKQFRITNARGNADFVEVNTGLPEDDITSTKADFVVSEQDWRATIRQANTDQLVEVIAKLAPVAPQIALATLDLIVEGMDIHQREEIVKRLRQTLNLRDPDATEPTEEEIAAEQEAQRRAQQAEEERQVQLDKIRSETARNVATAAKTHADTIGARVNAQKGAVETAASIVAAAGISPVADSVLAESGWPQETTAVQQPPAAAGIAPQPQAQPQPM